jgi:hypothetical protein
MMVSEDKEQGHEVKTYMMNMNRDQKRSLYSKGVQEEVKLFQTETHVIIFVFKGMEKPFLYFFYWFV